MKGIGADEPYWRALSAGHLEMQQCVGCGTWHWPAVWRCGKCGSWDHAWREVPLTGTVFTWTRTRHDFGASPDLPLPFVIVVVALDGAGHRRLLGTVLGDESALRIGARVVGEIATTHVDGEALPALRWRLAAGAAS